MKELDLEVAGEFILMAATLIQIKVRMLLPRSEGEGEEEEDPRTELVQRLLEYKRFKEVAESLIEIETHQRRLFPRSFFGWVKKYQGKEKISNTEFLKDVALFDLLSAFKTVIDNMPKVTAHEVQAIGVTIEDQITFILDWIKEKDRIGFREIMDQMKERVIIIVTFMAILELIRTHQIRIQQASIFGEIWILRK